MNVEEKNNKIKDALVKYNHYILCLFLGNSKEYHDIKTRKRSKNRKNNRIETPQ